MHTGHSKAHQAPRPLLLFTSDCQLKYVVKGDGGGAENDRFVVAPLSPRHAPILGKYNVSSVHAVKLAVPHFDSVETAEMRSHTVRTFVTLWGNPPPTEKASGWALI